MVYICPSVLFSGHHFELSSCKSFNLSLCSSNIDILLFLELTTYVPTSDTFIWVAISFCQGLCSTALLSLCFLPFFSWHLLLLEIISCINSFFDYWVSIISMNTKVLFYLLLYDKNL